MNDQEWQQAYNAGLRDAEVLELALAFYADPANWQTDWQEGNRAISDMGETARTALTKYREGKNNR